MRTKPLCFRATSKIQQYLESELEKNPDKKKSDIIIELCEKALSYSGQSREAPASPTVRKQIIIIDGPIEKALRKRTNELVEQYFPKPEKLRKAV